MGNICVAKASAGTSMRITTEVSGGAMSDGFPENPPHIRWPIAWTVLIITLAAIFTAAAWLFIAR